MRQKPGFSRTFSQKTGFLERYMGRCPTIMAKNPVFSEESDYRYVWKVNQIRNMANVIVGPVAAGFQDASLWE